MTTYNEETVTRRASRREPSPQEPRENLNGNEPLMVPTEDLKTVLDQWHRQYLAARDPYYDQKAFVVGRTMMGPIAWLEQESGVPSRRIYDIRNLTAKYVTLHTADRILTALDLTHLLHDGTVRVVENPRMTKRGIREALEMRGVDLLEWETA